MDGWRFPEPPGSEVVVLERILEGESAILLVTHDEDEPAWQFLDGDHVFEEDAVVACLGEIAQLDPTVIELADLPVGSHAWRAAAGGPWRRGEGEPPLELPVSEG